MIKLSRYIEEKLKICSNNNFKTFLTERLKINKDSKIIKFKTPIEADLFDILYENNSGEQIVNAKILDPKKGWIPIGLCVSNKDRAKFMSLKYMDYNNPDKGSLDPIGIEIGQYKNDVNTNHDETDLAGSQNTDKWLKLAIKQKKWKTESTINNKQFKGYSPAACCCWRYHTKTTNQGDWYLPAAYELLDIMHDIKDDLNEKLKLLNISYKNYTISSISENNVYWSSTECDNISCFCYAFQFIRLYKVNKCNNFYCLAFIQF